jgi:hypothetical protein
MASASREPRPSDFVNFSDESLRFRRETHVQRDGFPTPLSARLTEPDAEGWAARNFSGVGVVALAMQRTSARDTDSDA